MKTYARIEDGKVVELIAPMADSNGDEIAIENRFHPDFVTTLADVSGHPWPSIGDVATKIGSAWMFAAPVVPQPTADEIEAAKIKAAESAVQTMLDDAAKVERYDSILSAASYAALPVGAPFQAEGAAFALWRAQCWAKCYEVLAAVKAGTRDEPTIPELLAEMPAIVLP